MTKIRVRSRGAASVDLSKFSRLEELQDLSWVGFAVRSSRTEDRLWKGVADNSLANQVKELYTECQLSLGSEQDDGSGQMRLKIDQLASCRSRVSD